MENPYANVPFLRTPPRPPPSNSLLTPCIAIEDLTGGFKPVVKDFPPDKQGFYPGIPKLHMNLTTPSVSPFLTAEDANIIWKKKIERRGQLIGNFMTKQTIVNLSFQKNQNSLRKEDGVNVAI
jgi:hypothetical protein